MPVTRTWNAPRAQTVPDTVNRAGAPAYSHSPEFELASMLLSSFGTEDAYYETGDEKFQRLVNLLTEVPVEFQAQAALFARKTMNMRSLPQFVAANVLLSQPNPKWKSNFFSIFPTRADDPLEIMGAVTLLNSGPLKTLPSFLIRKKGFGKYLAGLDRYKLAKYSINVAHKERGRAWNLRDLINLCHPQHNPALEQLIKGTLAKADTHEVAVSGAVNAALEEIEQGADRETVKADVGRAEWERLLLEDKVLYMALLKNIRNILENKVSAEARVAMFAKLINPKEIRFCKVLPFRFLSAYKAVSNLQGQYEGVTDALVALSQAVALSLSNVSQPAGKGVVLVDESGSMMTTPINQRRSKWGGYQQMEDWQKIQAGEIGMLFAAALATKGYETVLFSDQARYVRLNPANSLFSAVDQLNRIPAGTSIVAALNTLQGAYDTIIILSDGQHWMHGSCDEALARYSRKFKCNPMVFSWNLVPYGSEPISLNRVRLMAGWSDKALDQIKWSSEDPNSLINHIKAIDLNGPYPII